MTAFLLPVTSASAQFERPAGDTATLVLAPTINPAIKRLMEFQFGGDTASHGVPIR